MPTRRFQPLKAKDTRTDQAYSEISQVIDALAPLEAFPLRTEARLDLAAGTFSRLSPRSSGQEVVVPTASAANFGQTITLLVRSSLGDLRIRAASGLISGASSYTIPAGRTSLIVLVSDGETGWVTERVFPAAGDFLAYDGETLDWTGTPGDSIAFDGTAINYVGNSDRINILAGTSGNLGTVDIAALTCGGCVAVSTPSGPWEIEGFTAKPSGFWFILVGGSNIAEGTIRDEDAPTATDRIRTPQGDDIIVRSAPQMLFFYSVNRWFCVPGAMMPRASRDPNVGVSSTSTSDQVMAQLTVAANDISEDDCFEFYGSCHLDHGGSSPTATIRFECPSGTARLTGTTPALSADGHIQIRGLITFGTPGAACPIYVTGEITYMVNGAATATVLLPQPSLIATVDTTASFTMLIESDGSGNTLTRTRTGSYIRQI